MESDMILKVADVSKRYKSGKGIENITFDVLKGTMLGVVGLNGAGKTTLLSSIVGIINIDEGEISYKFGDEMFSNLEANSLNDIGVVMRDEGFPDHFTAHIIDKIMNKSYKNWDSKKFFSIMSEFSIDFKKKIKQYSTGMRSILSLAIALSHNAKLLVLDEVTDGLDILARNKVRNQLFEFVEDGSRAVLFTTHIFEELEKMADIIVLINNGKVMINSSKDDLIHNNRVFKVTSNQLSKIEPEDILCIKEEGYFFSVLPKDSKLFVERYDIDLYWGSFDKIFEMLLDGEL